MVTHPPMQVLDHAHVFGWRRHSGSTADESQARMDAGAMFLLGQDQVANGSTKYVINLAEAGFDVMLGLVIASRLRQT